MKTAQHGAREAYLFQESTGMWQLSGPLPPVTGAALMAALDPLAGPEPATDGTPDPRSHRQSGPPTPSAPWPKPVPGRPGRRSPAGYRAGPGPPPG